MVLGACLRAPVLVVVWSSFPHCVPLFSLSQSKVLSWIPGRHLADVWLSIACPEGASALGSGIPKEGTAQELLSPDVSLVPRYFQ